METKDELLSEGEKYFEKVMHDFNHKRKGLNLRKYCNMTKRMMTKEQSEDFERYMECVRGLDEDQVSRLAAREYGSVLEMYEGLTLITTLALTYLTTTGTTNDNLLIIVSLAQLWLPYRQGKLF